MTALASLDEPTPVTRSSVGGLARSSWARGLGAHLALLLVVLVALIPFLDIDRAFTPDEGLYALQVEALDAGNWTLVPPSAAVDPELEFPPWRGIVVEDGMVLYARHPAYPLLLQALDTIGGGIEGALLLSGLGGVLATAAAAWFLSRELRPGSERLAFWLVALSPLLSHGYILWAHAPSVAATTWAAVFLIRAIRTRSVAAWCATGIALAVGVLLRSESLLLAAAFVAACGVAALVKRRRDVLLGAVGIAGALAVVMLVERAVIGSITYASDQMLSVRGAGGPSAGPAPGYLSGRIDGLRQTLLGGASYSDNRKSAAQLGAIVLVAGGALMARRGRSTVSVALVVLGLALLVLRVVAAPGDPITGLLVAWPIACVGAVGAVTVARRGDTATRVLIGGVALATLAIAATQYTDPGVNWGGRFFMPVVPILGVLAAASWCPDWPVARRTWNGGLLAVAAVLAALSLLSVRGTRAAYEEISDVVRDQQAPLAMTPIRSIPQALWNDEQAWMTVGVNDFDDALAMAEDAGIDSVVVVWPEGLPFDVDGWDAVPGEVVAPATWDVVVYRLTPA